MFVPKRVAERITTTRKSFQGIVEKQRSTGVAKSGPVSIGKDMLREVLIPGTVISFLLGTTAVACGQGVTAEFFPYPAGMSGGEAAATDSSATRAVGTGFSGNQAVGFIWSQESGVVPLPLPAGAPYVLMSGVTDEGIAFGNIGNVSGAVSWANGVPNPLTGPQGTSWLVAHGVDGCLLWTNPGAPGPAGLVRQTVAGSVQVGSLLAGYGRKTGGNCIRAFGITRGVPPLEEVGLVWTATLGERVCGPLPGDRTSFVQGVNTDGSRACGVSLWLYDLAGRSRPVIWDETGAPHEIEGLPFEESARAFAISGDGTTVVGLSASYCTADCAASGTRRPFFHRAPTGTQPLVPILRAAGVLPAGLHFPQSVRSVFGVSADGTTMLLDSITSEGPGILRVVVPHGVVAPSRCDTDYNLDGLVDPDDLADFLGAYFQPDPAKFTDYNLDGATNPDDLADFITNYFVGCA